MSLINCKINLILTCSEDCVISSKYQPKVSEEAPSQYLDFLIDSRFQGVIKIFVLSFENEDDRKVRTGYYPLKAEIKDCNVMIDGKTFLISQSKII